MEKESMHDIYGGMGTGTDISGTGFNALNLPSQ